MESDIKSAVIEALKHVKSEQGSSTKIQRKRTSPKAAKQQTAIGNNILQAENINNVTINNVSQKKNIVIPPPHGSIGANSFLTERIQGMFNELGMRRAERYKDTAYQVMYREFKKAFSIPKNQKYTTYLLWPESRAEEIINYLQEKLDNTIKGRKEKSASKRGHSIPYLLGKTRELHAMLGWKEDNYRQHLKYLFGVTSRADLNKAQLANYVEYLRQKIDEI
ncbi:hypothetical protein [uncultured Desulfovibrio sp.]|uniref:hypothetical protein n=1 Tax=uncultured Desulfovibrio sp. TaxID=167968 RepID=UPI002636A20E|nr:hypothetical protein [uncultured Desulfovibrio sp.]